MVLKLFTQGQPSVQIGSRQVVADPRELAVCSSTESGGYDQDQEGAQLNPERGLRAFRMIYGSRLIKRKVNFDGVSSFMRSPETKGDTHPCIKNPQTSNCNWFRLNKRGRGTSGQWNPKDKRQGDSTKVKKVWMRVLKRDQADQSTSDTWNPKDKNRKRDDSTEGQKAWTRVFKRDDSAEGQKAWTRVLKRDDSAEGRKAWTRVFKRDDSMEGRKAWARVFKRDEYGFPQEKREGLGYHKIG